MTLSKGLLPLGHYFLYSKNFFLIQHIVHFSYLVFNKRYNNLGPKKLKSELENNSLNYILFFNKTISK
jgi:hypothetical protein